MMDEVRIEVETVLARMPQTAAEVDNFGRGQTPPEVIAALAEVKEASLRAIQESGRPWPEDVFSAAL